MNEVYRIAKWSEVFERAESRKLKSLTWVAMPVGFQSNGYQSMIDEFGDQSPAIYGAWCALVSYAASCHVRGLLTNGRGEPLKLSHIARTTFFPVKIFEQLFAWAALPTVRWLEVVVPTDVNAEMATSNQRESSPGESPDGVPDRQENPPHTQPNLTQPNLTQQDITPTNLTEPDAAVAGAVGGELLKVDSEECLRITQRLQKALSKRHHDVDAASVWRWGWLSLALDQGDLLPELGTRLYRNEVDRPKRYIDKALRRICGERGLDLTQIAASVPEFPKDDCTAASTETNELRYRIFKPLMHSLGASPTDAQLSAAIEAVTLLEESLGRPPTDAQLRAAIDTAAKEFAPCS